MQKLMASPEVKVHRCVSSQLGGRMLTEIEAPDQATLANWFERHYVNVEWTMRIDLDAREGSVREV